MEEVNGSITHQKDGMSVEDKLFTYSEEEKQRNEANEANARLVFSPEFIPYRPDIKKVFQLSHLETLVYGFIRFYKSNASSRFYFTNQQLADIFECNETTAAKAVGVLISKKLIKVSYKIKAGGGKIRFVNQVLLGVREDTMLDLAKTPSPSYEKHHDNKNKIKENKINNNNIYISDELRSPEAVLGEETFKEGNTVNELISLFSPVNPSYRDLFKRKTQRDAVSALIKDIGLDQTRALINYLPRLLGDKYAPRITTPYELREKLGKLQYYIAGQANDKGGVIDARGV